MTLFSNIFKRNKISPEMWAQFHKASRRIPNAGDKDAPILTDAELLQMAPVAKRGRPRKSLHKQRTNVCFDADVLDALRASGRGWSTRLNNAVRDLLRKGVL